MTKIYYPHNVQCIAQNKHVNLAIDLTNNSSGGFNFIIFTDKILNICEIDLPTVIVSENSNQ